MVAAVGRGDDSLLRRAVLGCGVLAFIAGMPQLGVAIFVVIVLNGLFAFAQEERAAHATEGLQQMLPRRARVLRDGVSREISADDLVVGDVVLLSEGTGYRRTRPSITWRGWRWTPRL